MILTNAQRTGFIEAVMDDVPQTDYAAEAERWVKLAAVAAMPKVVVAAWLDDEGTDYIARSQARIGDETYTVPAPIGWLVPAETARKVLDLQAKAAEQREQRQALRAKLTALVGACVTSECLAESLPEFKQYLPTSPADVLCSPAMSASIAAEFERAGWRPPR